MSAMKHTPGPYEVQDPMGRDMGLWIVQSGLEPYEWSCIAIVPHDHDDERSGKHFITKAEQEANARLFAAAPNMLEAMKLAASVLRGAGAPGWGTAKDILNEAIAKAEGKE